MKEIGEDYVIPEGRYFPRGGTPDKKFLLIVVLFTKISSKVEYFMLKKDIDYPK